MATPINRSSIPPVDLPQILARDSKAGPVLQRLQQLGTFQAQVVLAQGRQILLDTAFGQVRGELAQTARDSSARLQPGDRIEASLSQAEGAPRLRVRSHQPLQLTLRQPELYQRLQQLQQPLLAARVSGRSEQHNLLRIGRELFRIPLQENLRTGDSLLLRPGPSAGQVVARRVQPLPLLRQALSQLLPQQVPASGDGNGADSPLTRLQQLARTLLAATGNPVRNAETSHAGPSPRPAAAAHPQASVQPPANRPEPAIEASARSSAAASSGNVPTHAASTASPEPAPLRTPAPRPGTAPMTSETPAAKTVNEPPVARTPETATAAPPAGKETAGHSRLQALLEPLLRLAIDPARVSPQQLQRALSALGLGPSTVTPAAMPHVPPGPQAAAGELLPRLIELHSLLRDQPELFDRLLRGTVSAQQTATADAPPADEPALWRQQFSQQLEQGINQLMLGKTGLRLQQEQQQPLNMNLVLPLQLPDEPQRELKLKLRERSNPDNPEQPAWEVRLSFEFGLLGLITVHVLLQEQRISAHFWAAEEPTWRLIDDQLPLFRRQLLRSGFEPGLFDCFHGQPSVEDEPAPAVDGGSLLDLQA